MAVTIKAARLESVSLERKESTGGPQSQGRNLCSHQLRRPRAAHQSVGSYANMVRITPSAETLRLMEAFVASYQNDISQALGLD